MNCRAYPARLASSGMHLNRDYYNDNIHSTFSQRIADHSQGLKIRTPAMQRIHALPLSEVIPCQGEGFNALKRR